MVALSPISCSPRCVWPHHQSPGQRKLRYLVLSCLLFFSEFERQSSLLISSSSRFNDLFCFPTLLVFSTGCRRTNFCLDSYTTDYWKSASTKTWSFGMYEHQAIQLTFRRSAWIPVRLQNLFCAGKARHGCDALKLIGPR